VTRAAATAVAATLALALAAAGTDRAPEVPARITIGDLVTLYPPVELDHAAHAEITGDCASCHHQPFGEPAACTDCHEEPIRRSAFVHEQHWQVENCTGCHHRPSTTDLRCVSCHAIEPDPEHLDLIGLKGAYHGLCLSCHAEAEAADSCRFCHPAS
jgi:hypothetical protein